MIITVKTSTVQIDCARMSLELIAYTSAYAAIGAFYWPDGAMTRASDCEAIRFDSNLTDIIRYTCKSIT